MWNDNKKLDYNKESRVHAEICELNSDKGTYSAIILIKKNMGLLMFQRIEQFRRKLLDYILNPDQKTHA